MNHLNAGPGTREHIFEWGTGYELQIHMEVCNNDGSKEALGVRGGAPDKILQSTPYNSMGNALF